jgi:hypothetical protein
MPLPVGTWTINADGSPGSLAVGGLTPDGSGNSFFTGTTTFGSNPQITSQASGTRRAKKSLFSDLLIRVTQSFRFMLASYSPSKNSTPETP